MPDNNRTDATLLKQGLGYIKKISHWMQPPEKLHTAGTLFLPEGTLTMF